MVHGKGESLKADFPQRAVGTLSQLFAFIREIRANPASLFVSSACFAGLFFPIPLRRGWA
jgi:hypothetical protein